MVETYGRRVRPRRPSGTLFGTFVAGVLIGFSLCYAFMVVPSKQERPSESSTPPSEGIVLSAPTAAGEPAARPVSEAPPEPQFVFDEEVAAGGLLFVAVSGTSLDPAEAAFLKDLRPAGVALREENLVDGAQTVRFVREIKNAVGSGSGLADGPLIALAPSPKDLVCLAGEEGLDAAALAEGGDEAAVREAGLALGKACRERGIGVVFQPVLDVYEGQSPFSGFERACFGSAKDTVTTMGLALADGLKAAGVVAVARSYPGMGAARRDDDLGAFIIDRDVQELAALLYPFAEAVAYGIPGVLVGSAAVPLLDQDTILPAALSSVVVQQMLRERLAYEGVIVSADLSNVASAKDRAPGETAVEALGAGCDILLFLNPAPSQIHGVCVAIEDAVNSGELSLDALASRRERLALWRNIVEEPREFDFGTEPDPGEAATAEPSAPVEGSDAAPAVEEPNVEDAEAEEIGRPAEEDASADKLSDSGEGGGSGRRFRGCRILVAFRGRRGRRRCRGNDAGIAGGGAGC